MILDELPALNRGELATASLVYIRCFTSTKNEQCHARLLCLRENGVIYRAAITCRFDDLTDFSRFRRAAAQTGLILSRHTTGKDFDALVRDAIEHPGREGFTW